MSGMFTGSQTMDPAGASPQAITNLTAARQTFVACLHRVTLDLQFVYTSTIGINNAANGGYVNMNTYAVPLADQVVHLDSVNVFTGGLSLHLYDAAQTLDTTFAPFSTVTDSWNTPWYVYDQLGNYVDGGFYLNTAATFAVGYYGLYIAAVRDDDRVIFAANVFKRGVNMSLQDSDYALGEPAAATLEFTGNKGAYAIGVLDGSGPVALTESTVYTGGGTDFNPAQIMPIAGSRRVKGDAFAIAGGLYRNSNSAVWTFNYGKGSAFNLTMNASVQNGGFVAKYDASSLDALWAAQFDNGAANGTTVAPWTTTTDIGDLVYQGLWFRQGRAVSVDIVDDGTVVAGGAVVAATTSWVARTSAAVALATGTMTNVSGAAPTTPQHGIIVKFATDGASVLWAQLVEQAGSGDFLGASVSQIIVREDLDAVFAFVVTGDDIELFEDAANAGNGYVVGGTVTTRNFPTVAGGSTLTGWALVRYNLTTGALEGVYTAYARTGSMGGLIVFNNPLFFAGALTDTYDGLLVATLSADTSIVDLDPEGPVPATLAATGTSRNSYLVKLDYDLALLASKGQWSSGANAPLRTMPVTLL